jgi:hypothetical protein
VSARTHRRTTGLSPTQNVDCECPCCGELVRCVVEHGVFDGVVYGCDLQCHRRSDFPMAELDARAVSVALVERHEYEWPDRCGYDKVER